MSAEWPMADPLLEVRDLQVYVRDRGRDGQGGRRRLVLGVQPGRRSAIVGESGSGKSVSSLTVMGLMRLEARPTSPARCCTEGQDLLKLPADEMRRFRGAKISMIFQDPMTSLHPFYRVGDQIAETIRQHQDVTKKEASARRSTCSAG